MRRRMTRVDWEIRLFLLNLRTHALAGPVITKPYSVEHLFLIQQSKRVSLSMTIGRFSRWNFLLWPFLTMVVVIKWIDLSLATTVIRSLINEFVLQRLSAESRGGADLRPEAEQAPSPVGDVANNPEG